MEVGARASLPSAVTYASPRAIRTLRRADPRRRHMPLVMRASAILWLALATLRH